MFVVGWSVRGIVEVEAGDAVEGIFVQADEAAGG